MYAKDTIAAIATPPGAGGIGIIRLSGPEACSIAERVFVATQDRRPDSHRFRRGTLVDGAGEPLDDALSVVMYAPHSYTGEDTVELHCHGSPVILRRALERCLECGARLAEPGEFTKRAYLNGKLDLVQAEAVAELISARTLAAARTSLRHLSGRLSAELRAIRDALISVKARVEVMIDFSEEDVDLSPEMLIADVESAALRIEVLLASYRRGQLLREGLHLALVGRPNVGKSSLLNALLGSDRAIVAPVPGTTRDVIVESTEIHGIPVVLADTAGLRGDADAIERLGIERTHAQAATADALLVVLDGSSVLQADDQAALAASDGAAVIAVVNKTDLPPAWNPRAVDELRGRAVVEVSALTGRGIDALRDAIVAIAAGGAVDPHQPILTLARHRDALSRAGEALSLARRALRAGDPIDAIAVDIQAAVEHIGGLIGEVTTEDVLDRIFRDFCIGK